MILRLLILVFLCGCQKKSEPITSFDKLYSIKSSFDENNKTLVVDIALDKNIHAYAQGEKIGVPLMLEISPKNDWQKEGEALIPKGEVKELKGLGQSVVLLGNIQVRQKLKRGKGPGEANLHLQVCSENTCDKPRIHALQF